MELGVHGEVMVRVQRHVVLVHKQEVVLVTIPHLLMVEQHVLVQVLKLKLVITEDVL